MKHLVCLLLILSHFAVFGQGKKEIVKYQIKTKTEHKADYKDGNGKLLLDEHYIYDNKGNTIQESTYDKFGKQEKEIKYFFDENNLLEKEEEYNAKGKLIKMTIYTYNEKGLKTSKKEYDGNNKLLVEKTYTYEFY